MTTAPLSPQGPGRGDDQPQLVTEPVTGEASLAGRVVGARANRVREPLLQAVDACGGTLVLDLSAVTVIDAAGIGVLVGAHRRARAAGGELVLVGVPERLERIIRATRLSRVLHRDAALAHR